MGFALDEERRKKEVQSFFFLVNEHISPGAGARGGLFKGCCRGEGYKVRAGGRRSGQTSLFDQPLGYISVGYLDLLVTGAGVGELFAPVGVVQVLPDGGHLFGDVKASVLLGYHLREDIRSYKSPQTEL